jgi:hypothetical protein
MEKTVRQNNGAWPAVLAEPALASRADVGRGSRQSGVDEYPVAIGPARPSEECDVDDGDVTVSDVAIWRI